MLKKVPNDLIKQDSENLKWMRHMWAFYNAQTIKEMNLFMRLKIDRTMKLMSKYKNVHMNTQHSLADEFDHMTSRLKELIEVSNKKPIRELLKDINTRTSIARRATVFGIKPPVEHSSPEQDLSHLMHFDHERENEEDEEELNTNNHKTTSKRPRRKDSGEVHEITM